MASRYWVGGGSTTNWTATGPTNWSATSGGSGDASVPISTDDVFFDANSGSGSALVTVSQSMATLDCNGYTGSLGSGLGFTFTGNGGVVRLSSTMTFTSMSAAFTGSSGTILLTLNGKGFRGYNVSGAVTVQMQDAGTCSAIAQASGGGTFDTNGFSLAITGATARMQANSGGTIKLGSSSVSIAAVDSNTTNTALAILAGSTFTAAINSTITLTNTGTSAKSINNATGVALGNINLGTVAASGNNFKFTGLSFTMGFLAVNVAGATLGFTPLAGNTYTMTGFTTNGAGSTCKIQSSSAGVASTFTAPSTFISAKFMTIQDITVDNNGLWFAGDNSVNVSGNSGWVYKSPNNFRGFF